MDSYVKTNLAFYWQLPAIFPSSVPCCDFIPNSIANSLWLESF